MTSLNSRKVRAAIRALASPGTRPDRGLLTTLPLLPILAFQGRQVRSSAIVLPDASGPASGTTCPSDTRTPIRLVAVGDSTVAGVGAPTHELALTGQLASAVSQLNGRPVRWHAYGRSGATAAGVRRSVLPGLTAQQADLLVVSVGVNDVLRSTPLSKWRAELDALVRGAQAALDPAATVVVGIRLLAMFPSLPYPLRSVLGSRARGLRDMGQTSGQGRRSSRSCCRL